MNIFNKNSLASQLFGLYFFLIIIAVAGIFYIRQQTSSVNTLSKEEIAYHTSIQDYTSRLNSELNYLAFLSYNYFFLKQDYIKARSQGIWQKLILPHADSLSNTVSQLEQPLIEEQAYEIRKDIILLESFIKTFLQENYRAENRNEWIEKDKNFDLLINKIRQKLNEISSESEAAIRSASFSILENSQRTQSFIIGFVITLVLISIFISWYLLQNLLQTTKHVSQQINAFQEGNLPEKLPQAPREVQALVNHTNQLSDTLLDLKELANQVSNGNFDARIKVFSEEGKLGKALYSMRESLKNIAIENRERNWLNEGYAKFSEILRNSANEGEQLYQVVISTLVRYLDVQQGGIFALNNEENDQEAFMELKASYAVDRKKYLVRHIKQDVGLIGQVWREKDQVYITDIPEDYADIPTGMSQARPHSILVTPLITSGQVLGVLELISLKELPNFHLDFVERVSESIATTIARIKVDSETKVLLEESKFMADRMKSQEEEMLQSMEELVATQEKMELNAGEMRTQLQALNENFIMLEMNIQGYVTKVNDLALATTGYTESDLLNQHFSIIHGKNLNQDMMMARWDEVMRGHFIKGEFERTRKNGHPFWINEVMYPLYNSQGEIYKVCLVAYDISKQKEQEQKIKEQLNQLYMSKRDVVNRIREVEKKARTEIQRIKLELTDKIKEKEKIISELKNVSS